MTSFDDLASAVFACTVQNATMPVKGIIGSATEVGQFILTLNKGDVWRVHRVDPSTFHH